MFQAAGQVQMQELLLMGTPRHSVAVGRRTPHLEGREPQSILVAAAAPDKAEMVERGWLAPGFVIKGSQTAGLDGTDGANEDGKSPVQRDGH